MQATVLRPDFLALVGKVAKDSTSAERSRRYRRRRKARRDAAQAATAANTVAVTTSTMAALAGRLSAGSVTAADLELAGRLVLALVQLLPPDGAIGLPNP